MNPIYYTAFIASVVGIVGLFYSRNVYIKSSNIIRNLKHSLDDEIKNISDVTKILDDSEIFKEAIERSSVGITISDMTADGQPTIYANQAFTELTGYTREFVLGKNCRFLQGPDTEVSIKAEIKDAIAKGKRFQCIITNYRSDGTQFKNNLVLIPIFSNASRTKLSYYLANQSLADS
jgi:PAS domain S-box-containing protein